MAEETYQQTILEWRKTRDENIRKENNWLALAGLYWLKLGKNQFGSDPKSEIQLPERIPANVGAFEFSGKSVNLRANPGMKVSVDDQVTEFAVLQPDISENPSFIKLEGIQMVVIQRGNKMGVRMWDNLSEKRASFPARTWYAIDEAFRIPALYTSPAKNPSFPSKAMSPSSSMADPINWTSTKKMMKPSSCALGTPPTKTRPIPPGVIWSPIFNPMARSSSTSTKPITRPAPSPTLPPASLPPSKTIWISK
jgi:hypothetical protein